jgi:hypothetical protein
MSYSMDMITVQIQRGDIRHSIIVLIFFFFVFAFQMRFVFQLLCFILSEWNSPNQYFLTEHSRIVPKGTNCAMRFRF